MTTNRLMEVLRRFAEVEMDEHDHDHGAEEAGGHDHGFECGGGNEYDGRMGLRISAIFVIGVGSMLGALLPIMAARSKSMNVPRWVFFICKYFGSGVIIATAFIHLLAPAQDYLKSECLSGPITEYPWVEGIALMTIFSMFFLELMASRFDFGPKHSHDHDLESSPGVTASGSMPMTDTTHSHSHNHGKTHQHTDTIRSNTGDDSSSSSDHHHSPDKMEPYSDIPIAQRTTSQFAEFPGNSDHLSHQRNHHENENFAAQMTSIFILEFGVIFHSIFIGLTLAVAGDEFVVLYIVLVFHQTFEGLGLGSRLGTMEWPRSKTWLPWVLGVAYGLTTPIAIAIGLGIRETFVPGSTTYLMVNGIFDSISAGILIYTGLVELMAHEFMFNAEMRKGSMTKVLSAFGCMCLGAGLMALLGKWA